MLGADADPDEPRRDAAEDGEATQEPERRAAASRVAAAASTGAITRFWSQHLEPLRDARRQLAPALDRRRSSARQRRSRSGAASRLAAATASWIARLMPTPPTGDIACAASPMQSRPGRYHCRRRSTVTVSSLTSSQSRDSPTRSASERHDARDARRGTPRVRARRISSIAALGDHVAALPVVAAVDHRRRSARGRSGPWSRPGSSGRRDSRNHSTSIGAPRSSHRQARPCSRTIEWRPSAPTDEIGADLAAGRRASSPARRRPGPPRRSARSTSALHHAGWKAG